MHGAGSARHALHRLRVTAVEPLVDDAVAVTLDVPDDLREVFSFLPGQHVALVRNHGGDQTRRSYSVCSPLGGPLRVAVKLLPDGVFSTWVHDELRPGDHLDVLPPTGRFTVRPDPARAGHYAAVAAGSGITPVLSIVASLLAAEPESRCTVIYGNRTTSSIMFLEELEDLKDRYTSRLHLIHVLSRESQPVELAEGRIDRPKLERLLAELVPPETVDEWFLCGPLGLIDVARATLVAAGVPSAAIHRELFHAEAVTPSAPAVEPDTPDDGASVTIILDGRRTAMTVPRRGAPILDAALAVRSDAPYACRGGVCGTCRCRVTEGEVRMDHAYALEDDEIGAGLVLACQSHPVTDAVVLDFDAT